MLDTGESISVTNLYVLLTSWTHVLTYDFVRLFRIKWFMWSRWREGDAITSNVSKHHDFLCPNIYYTCSTILFFSNHRHGEGDCEWKEKAKGNFIWSQAKEDARHFNMEHHHVWEYNSGESQLRYLHWEKPVFDYGIIDLKFLCNPRRCYGLIHKL